MTTQAIIVGGGLGGLAAAWQLHRNNVEFHLLEARARLGGRVLTLAYDGGSFDLGPSWVWHGQPHVAGLLNHFGVATHEQFCDGDLLHQLSDGSTRRDSMFTSTGPLAEIHDASPAQGGPAALMGFVGVDGAARARMADGELAQAAVAQLCELFGDHAARPTHHHLMDWSDELFTAAPADRTAPAPHPQYGTRPQLPEAWRETLHFIGSETSPVNGGLVEGALQQGFAFAHHVIRHQHRPATNSPGGESGAPHNASMSWDWLDVRHGH